MTVIAHAGNLISSLIYLAPVVVVLGVLIITTIGDRRACADKSRESDDDSEQ